MTLWPDRVLWQLSNRQVQDVSQTAALDTCNLPCAVPVSFAVVRYEVLTAVEMIDVGLLGEVL
jgi:hypothetical protein